MTFYNYCEGRLAVGLGHFFLLCEPILGVRQLDGQRLRGRGQLGGHLLALACFFTHDLGFSTGLLCNLEMT